MEKSLHQISRFRLPIAIITKLSVIDTVERFGIPTVDQDDEVRKQKNN